VLPEPTGRRPRRELRDLDYTGGYTLLDDFLHDVSPPRTPGFGHRIEPAPGRQGQVDFAQFGSEFIDEPGTVRTVWLFFLVLGHSRMLWVRFVVHQNPLAVLRCHMAALERSAASRPRSSMTACAPRS
jgi:transposase